MAKSWVPNVFTDKVMQVAEAAYVAGFLDGEGCIGLWQEQYPKNRTGIRFNPSCSISGTELDTLLAIRTMMGNGRISGEAGRPRRKTCYRLMLAANQIRRVLPQLMPYLILKRGRAELLLEYLDIVEERGRQAPWELRRVGQIVEELARLNRRGNKEVSPETRELLLRPIKRREQRFCDMEGCQSPHWGHGYCRSHYRQLFEYALVKRVSLVCKQCGTSFVGLPKRTYCSVACSSEAARAKRRVPKELRNLTCPECGTEFTTTTYNKKYCGSRCYFRHYQREVLPKRKETTNGGRVIGPRNKESLGCPNGIPSG